MASHHLTSLKQIGFRDLYPGADETQGRHPVGCALVNPNPVITSLLVYECDGFVAQNLASKQREGLIEIVPGRNFSHPCMVSSDERPRDLRKLDARTR